MLDASGKKVCVCVCECVLTYTLRIAQVNLSHAASYLPCDKCLTFAKKREKKGVEEVREGGGGVGWGGGRDEAQRAENGRF